MAKHVLKEYFMGSPDTMVEYDDNGGGKKNSFHYTDGGVISFGFFNTSLYGERKFIWKLDKTHNAIAYDITKKIIGKAYGCEDVDAHFENTVRNAVYDTATFTGRIFLRPRVITTWGRFSSEKLAEIIDFMGGVDKYGDFVYVTLGNKDNSSVIDYINSNHQGSVVSSVEDAMERTTVADKLDEDMIKIIDDYNAPNSKLADMTAKLGRMTIAQYHSLLNQEGKKSKKTLNEIKNMKKSKYQKEFSNYIEIMNEALMKNDFKAYDYAKEMLEESIEDCKRENELLSEMNTNNFGILNHIFEQQLPTLIKSNKRGVKAVMTAIKEDKNLLAQFNFYNVVKTKYRGNTANIIESNDVLEKLAEISVKDIDQKSVISSNKKLKKIMLENNIIPNEFIDDENKKLYESCHTILTSKKTTSNMIPLIESYHNVCEYMERHKNDGVKESKDIDELIGEFEDKLKNNLNESEMSFVKQITDFRTPIAEKRKEKLFNKFKNECIEKINEMLKEDSENTELKNLSEQINGMKFSNESIVKDIAKLLEIRDILMDD